MAKSKASRALFALPESFQLVTGPCQLNGVKKPTGSF